MRLTDKMPKAVRRADAAGYQKWLRVVELEEKLKRKILEDPGPGPPSPPPPLWEASSIAGEATAENLLADAGELTDRQEELYEAFQHLLAAVSAAGGGPWKGRPDLTEKALTD